MKEYLKKNIVPIGIQLAFIISCFLLPKEYFIYTNFIFYATLFGYFLLKKELHFREWKENIKSGKKFWIQTLVTGLLFMAAFVMTSVLENLFPQLNTGMIVLQRDSIGKLILFAFSTILFPAITEETFYRKNMISFNSKKFMIITTFLSMFLYALEHALSIWGIILTMIWALPLSLSYIKTKNIYVPMTAHFIGSLLGNGIDIIFTVGMLI